MKLEFCLTSYTKINLSEIIDLNVDAKTKKLLTIKTATAAKSLQSCPTLCDPIAHQAPPSLGFSKQEHWSGLPFPSPMHESEKRK